VSFERNLCLKRFPSRVILNKAFIQKKVQYNIPPNDFILAIYKVHLLKHRTFPNYPKVLRLRK